MPFFTVIIPLYNKEAYIRRSLNSVLTQTFGDFEIVVVDDGSTDKSVEIVASYDDPRIRLIKQPNGGVSVARNRGIADATTDWVAFLDADDEYLPEFLRKTYECIARFPDAGLVFTRTAQVKKQKQIRIIPEKQGETRVLDDYLHSIGFENGFDITSSCVAVRKNVFDRAGNFPIGVSVGEDIDMWMRVAWTTKIAYIPEFLATYHLDAGQSNWEATWYGQEPNWVETYRKWLADGRIPPRLRKSARNFYHKTMLWISLVLARQGNRAKARNIMLRYRPWCFGLKRLTLRTYWNVFAPTWAIESLGRLRCSMSKLRGT